MLQIGYDRPIFLRAEQLDLALAIDDHAQRHRLHAARRFGTRQLAPQHGRKRKANQIVQCTARAIGVDQVLVERARGSHCGLHRRFGDGVEGDALHLGGQRLFLGKNFAHVPADRLALTVGVGRKDQPVGVLRRIGDGFELLCLVGVVFPLHREPLVGVHRPVARRQVADMAVGCEYAVVAAEIAFDGFGLGRRLDDDQIFQAVLPLIRTREGDGGNWEASSGRSRLTLDRLLSICTRCTQLLTLMPARI